MFQAVFCRELKGDSVYTLTLQEPSCPPAAKSGLPGSHLAGHDVKSKWRSRGLDGHRHAPIRGTK